MRRLLIALAITTGLLGFGLPSAAAAPPPPGSLGTTTVTMSAPEWWDAGSGYVFWGCHLTISAPLANISKGNYTFVASFRASDSTGYVYWDNRSPIRLRRGTTQATWTSTGVFSPTETVYGGRITLYAGKTQIAQSETTLTTPLVCPAQTP